MKRVLALVAALMLVAPPASASSWRDVPVPVAKGDITAVAALSSSQAWAVGYRLVSDDEARPVSLRWNGSAWAQESELPRDAFPHALEVRSPSDIWAVGDGVHHWDGTAWRAERFAPDPFLPESLDSVPSGQAWVVGRLVGDSVKNQSAAVYAWNGSSWARQTIPDVGVAALNSVVAVSATDVWAAGFVAGSPQRSLILHWDGVSWSQVPSPSVAGEHTWISGLHSSSDGVWAVGGSGVEGRPFSAFWDGRSWKTVLTPRIADGRLRSVVAAGDGTVYAVGGKGAVSVALRWHKVLKRWVRVAAPDIVVRGVSGVPGSSSLWAVGVSRRGDLVPAVTRLR